MGTKTKLTLARLRTRYPDYQFEWSKDPHGDSPTKFIWCSMGNYILEILNGFTELETYAAVEAILEMRRKPVNTLARLKVEYPKYEFYWEKTEPGKPDALCWEEPPRNSKDFQCYCAPKCRETYMEVDRTLRSEEDDDGSLVE